MSLKKLRKRMGCLMLTGAMIFAGSHTALAAEYKANLQQSDLSRESNHSEVGGDKETEPPTEQSESHSESESERQTESETHTSDQEETKVAIDVETETETLTESEPVTDETEEPTSDTEKPNGDDSGDKEKVPQIVDRNDPKDELEQIDHPGREDGQEDHSDANANLTTNIIAGNGIYLSELSGTYYLTFEDHFSKVMDEIEKDFKQWLDKPEQFIARNWQDVLAVYVLRTPGDYGKPSDYFRSRGEGGIREDILPDEYPRGFQHSEKAFQGSGSGRGDLSAYSEGLRGA